MESLFPMHKIMASTNRSSFTLLFLFSHSVVSDSLRAHGLQCARLPCPSLSPRVCSNSCPLSQWCHATISFSVTQFSSCPQYFPAIRVFSNDMVLNIRSSSGQSIGASASVLPMNIQGWFPLGLTSLISLISKGFSRVFSSSTVWKHQFFSAQPSLWSNSHLHDYWKNHGFDYMHLCWQSDVSVF